MVSLFAVKPFIKHPGAQIAYRFAFAELSVGGPDPRVRSQKLILANCEISARYQMSGQKSCIRVLWR